MARNNTRASQTGSLDRARLRAGAETWHALAATAVALMCVAPALLIGALLMLEAVLTTSPRELAYRSPTPLQQPSWRPNAPLRLQLSSACTYLELASCRSD
jgi:hypothetical protein